MKVRRVKPGPCQERAPLVSHDDTRNDRPHGRKRSLQVLNVGVGGQIAYKHTPLVLCGLLGHRKGQALRSE